MIHQRLFNVYNSIPIELIKGSGFHLFDENGQRYLDFYGGHAVVSIGHLHSHYIIAFKGSLHCRTSGSTSSTDNTKILAPFNSKHEVVFLNYKDLLSVEKELRKRNVCALITEGIQGISGIIDPGDFFLREIQNMCRYYETVFILDEIQSGYGRTGDFFAHQRSGVNPDLISLAKGMGNGFQIGGVLINPKYEEYHLGAPISSYSEVVFNTPMTGYVESLTDPSYFGQILLFTYPSIGNYGVPSSPLSKKLISRFYESNKVHVSGLIVSDYSHINGKMFKNLSNWLKEYKVPDLYGFDTRW